jgi:N-acetylmuramoyl-L-alanine amidase
VISIDPGHNGANAQHVAEIDRLVWIGNGTKACNTVGTSTDAGYPEHAFNWDVATRVVAKLRAAGATVVLTRPNDAGWGPCIDQRAAIANGAHAAAAVSIHADGGPAGGRGFHVIEPARIPGLNDANVTPSARLGSALRDAVRAGSSFPTSTYAGSNGIVVSSIYGGLNLAKVPAVFIECANMRNATDAALLVQSSVRDRLATAIVAGIAAYLAG